MYFLYEDLTKWDITRSAERNFPSSGLTAPGNATLVLFNEQDIVGGKLLMSTDPCVNNRKKSFSDFVLASIG